MGASSDPLYSATYSIMTLPVGHGFHMHPVFSTYPLLGACLLTTYAHKCVHLLTRIYGILGGGRGGSLDMRSLERALEV